MIVHLMMDEKFTSDTIQIIEENFNMHNEHRFLIITTHEQLKYKLNVTSDSVVLIRKDLKSLLRLASYMKKSDRIIIHGLFNPLLIYLIWMLNTAPKSIWCIWGGDLYNYRTEKPFLNVVKKRIIRRLHGVATQITGDYELAKKWYGFQGKQYVSGIIVETVRKDEMRRLLPGTNNIIIGNSADPENRHLFILEKLKGLHLENAKIIIPLSYGDRQYADEIEQAYNDTFGEQAICLREFMDKKDYYQLLNEMDVAIYAHQRQQGVGNICYLLQVGVKVYLEPYVTTYSWLEDNGIHVFNIEELDQTVMNRISDHDADENTRIMRALTSKESVISQLANLFEN